MYKLMSVVLISVGIVGCAHGPTQAELQREQKAWKKMNEETPAQRESRMMMDERIKRYDATHTKSTTDAEAWAKAFDK